MRTVNVLQKQNLILFTFYFKNLSFLEPKQFFLLSLTNKKWGKKRLWNNMHMVIIITIYLWKIFHTIHDVVNNFELVFILFHNIVMQHYFHKCFTKNHVYRSKFSTFHVFCDQISKFITILWLLYQKTLWFHLSMLYAYTI